MRPVALLLVVVACAGCTWMTAKKDAEPAAPQEQQKVESTYAGPPASAPPATWVKGRVFRVWPYGQGELMADLGAQDGIRIGDTLALQRGGLSLNSIEVVEVNEKTFYGRVVRRDDPGVWPKEGDMAVVVPPTGR
jgi:hypothetical protein